MDVVCLARVIEDSWAGQLILRVIQTIAGTQVHHGGTSRSVPALCDALQDHGVDNFLMTFQPRDPQVECIYPRDRSRVHLLNESRWGRQYGIGRQVHQALDRLIQDANGVAVVHDHAVWLPSNHSVAKYCSIRKVPRVVSPRGMLGNWALNHGKWKKRIAWMLYQKSDLVNATAFHATSEQEAQEIRALGFKQPIAIVPNGISLPEALPSRTNQSAKRRALFLSRIHPKKGLIELVQAWKIAEISDNWELVIAGPDENGFRAIVEQQIATLRLEESIRFCGPIDDSDKWQAYRNADLFVLPSFNENFGIVIAEAMAAELPVLTTTGTPWKCLQEFDMGWWVEPKVDELANALRVATSQSSSALSTMGLKARSYVSNNFSWHRSAADLYTFYQSLLGNPS